MRNRKIRHTRSSQYLYRPTHQKAIIHQVNIDELIDENIGAIREALFELDPTDLVDVKFPVTPHIYMDLHTGWLQNLSLLKRAGRSALTYTNRLITADLTLGWDEIAFDYRYLLRVLLITRQGDLHGQLSQLKVNVVIDVDLDSYQVTLRRLSLNQSGKVTISLEGHILDKIYNLVLKALTKVCKQLIMNTIQSKASNIVQSKMDEINEKIGKNHNVVFTFVNLVEAEPVPAIVYED
ncbi:uncharacterized protein LOC100680146 isoform X2 [Nasonia vitripennis]|uniref:BPI1 domain-containing protein n=1 Tax=Nasonia vitripennis TaxID=7425 RepID=A0A7M7PVD0_NASVI|nr:uncharacterized protein LOC100680146 isoform X2 [Nasonia vitripennis]